MTLPLQKKGQSIVLFWQLFGSMSSGLTPSWEILNTVDGVRLVI
jgi:hypothetical protein